ncbi:MAG: T9SS type A sorting domain-containing protein [Candidatus Delongbacteria bacterium]|nr:T9SS type A sorting domain-containing protein [Candidatus Delongbacteria bacterium]
MKKNILLIVLIGILLPIYAQVATTPAVGNGTEGNPYQIANLENLYWITADTLNFHSYYIQTADIDASDTENWFVGDHDEDSLTVDEPMGWKPIGNYSEIYFPGIFDGTYDGQGHIIDNLYINHIPHSFEESMSGLFGCAQNAEIKNLGVTNSTITGGSNVGLIAGGFSGTITNCYSTGNVSGGWAVGGLVGEGSVIMEKCYSEANVSGGNYTGGIIGYLNGGSISSSFSTGSITYPYEDTIALSGLGGIVGCSNGNIINCYSTSDIYGYAGTYGGGFVGRQEGGNIENSFSCGVIYSDLSGGFKGSGYGNIINCFWDEETSGVADSTAYPNDPIGLTTVEMQTLAAYNDATWDFVGETTNGTEDIWDIDGVTNNGYPFLRWMNEPIAIAPADGNGTIGNPYQIANLENLYWITADTLNFHSHYIQTADIDASETQNWFVGDHDEDSLTVDEPMGWKPIGNFHEENISTGNFHGTYDGQGHIIDSLYINHIPISFDEAMSGLFGATKNAEVKNLGITNGTITGGSYAGLLAGGFLGTITNCYSTGSVSGGWAVGGLVGEGWGIMEKCYSEANVTGGNYTGGLIGSNMDGTISQCYSTGDVTILGGMSMGYGGFVGHCEGYISNCYTSSNVTGDGAAGFVGGGGNITNSFSYGELTGGSCNGFAGSGSVGENCFWDIETSGTSISYDGIGLTTTEMQSASTFTDAGMDFVGETTNGTEDIWDIDGVTNNGYPFLAWISTTSIDNEQLTIDNYRLEQNYPNPFNPTTTISFSIPSMQDVKISVYNSNGQLVKELVNDKLSSGNHSVLFNAENLNSGIYFYTLQTDGKKLSNKMLLIK